MNGIACPIGKICANVDSHAVNRVQEIWNGRVGGDNYDICRSSFRHPAEPGRAGPVFNRFSPRTQPEERANDAKTPRTPSKAAKTDCSSEHQSVTRRISTF